MSRLGRTIIKCSALASGFEPICKVGLRVAWGVHLLLVKMLLWMAKMCIHRGLTPFPAMPMESMTGCVPTGDGLQEHPDLMLALRLALRGWNVPPLIVYRVS